MTQVLDSPFGENEGEDTEQHSDTDEQVSEEDNVEYHPEDIDTSDESDEEVTGGEAAPAERFKSKNGKIFCCSVPHNEHGRSAAANVINMTPGITRFAVTRVSDIKTIMPLSLKRVIIAMTNLEGKKVHGDMWKDIDEEYLDAYCILVFFFLLECTDPAMRPLIAFGTH